MGNDRLRRRNGEEKRARLYKANGSRLKGVYNRTEAKAHGWVKRHGHGQVYATVEELLADEEITAVYIATPPATHFDYAMQVIAVNRCR